MKENLKYVNHLNEVFEFAAEEAYVFESDLHDYSWGIIQKNNKISGFARGLTKKQIPILLHCRDESRGFELRNKLFELTEKDVIAEKPGRLMMNGYYLLCYVTAAKKTDYLYRKRFMKIGLEITVEWPFWRKETTTSYMPTSGGEDPSYCCDFPFDFPHGYASNVSSASVLNRNFMFSEFRLRIYGDCVNPQITIGNHTYKVNCTINTDEYLTIDSSAKTIILTTVNGEEINKFSSRDKNNYIFELIPSGESVLAWNGDFGFDLTLIEERSEPKWI